MSLLWTVIIAWLAFNVGFFLGAVWQGLWRRHKQDEFAAHTELALPVVEIGHCPPRSPQ